MKKLAIPAILAATVMVAGMFAFMPIEQASTVHTTVTANTNELIEIASASAINLDDDPQTLMTATNSGIVCYEIEVTDTAGGNPDPAVDILVGGKVVQTVDPGDGQTIEVNDCSAIEAGETIQYDQDGPDGEDNGNDIDVATAILIADTDGGLQ